MLCEKNVRKEVTIFYNGRVVMSMSGQKNFYEKVYAEVKKIPKGKVATYGQIAGMISTPRAARVVGFALRSLGTNPSAGGRKGVPWQRVINARGMISIESPFVTKVYQAQLLRKEGVEVKEQNGNFFVDLVKFSWNKADFFAREKYRNMHT